MLAIYSVPGRRLHRQRPGAPVHRRRRRLPLAAGRRQRRPGPPLRPPVHRRRPGRRRLGAVPAGRGRPPARRDRRRRRRAAAAGRPGPRHRPAQPAHPGRHRRGRRRRQRRQRADQPVRLALRPAQPDRRRSPTSSRSPPTSRTRSTCGSASPTCSTRTASATSRPTGRPLSRRPARPARTAGDRRRRPSPQYRADGRGHQRLRADPGRRSTPTRPTRRTSTAPGRTTRTTQVVFSNRTTTHGQEVLVRLRPRRSTPPDAAAPGRAAARGRPAASGSSPPSRTSPRSRTLVAAADQGQGHRLRQGHGDLQVLLPGERLPLQPAPPQTERRRLRRSPTSWSNKSGYCQQYAAAMAWMVREAGIPARVAFGFTSGSGRDGNAYVITNRNAARLDRGLPRRLRLGPVRRHPGRRRAPAPPAPA